MVVVSFLLSWSFCFVLFLFLYLSAFIGWWDKLVNCLIDVDNAGFLTRALGTGITACLSLIYLSNYLLAYYRCLIRSLKTVPPKTRFFFFILNKASSMSWQPRSILNSLIGNLKFCQSFSRDDSKHSRFSF